MKNTILLLAISFLCNSFANANHFGDSCSDSNRAAPSAAGSVLPIETRLVVANPGSNVIQQTFLRFINPNDAATSVEVYGIDDGGNSSKNSPISFTLDANASKQFNAQDMENGNFSKGLGSHLCNGQGKWQLLVRSDNPVQVMGLIRTPDGFLTSLNDQVSKNDTDNMVYFANPASNITQQTFIRIVNLGAGSGNVTITGIDDNGTPSSGTMTFTLGPNESKQINAQELEGGNPDKGLNGSLGNGTGKWRLNVNSILNLAVMSLIRTPDGFLTNLSGMVETDEFGDHVIYFANPASDTGKQTFLRIINTTDQTGTVAISGIDDTGQPASSNVLFDLGPHQSKQMNAQDLEAGNTGKGLIGMLGQGSGRWRLTVSAGFNLEVMSLVRTPDGFLTNLSRVAPVDGDTNEVFFFNPASNVKQISSLRIINTSNQQGSVTITGTDDAGNTAPGGDIIFNIQAMSAMALTSQDLENGNAGLGLVGMLGNGIGKWHLQVSSDVALVVQGLMDTPSGFLTNISRVAEGVGTGISANEFFNENISEAIIQSTCIECHRENGIASLTPLLYIRDTEPGYQNANFQTLSDYLEGDESRAALILSKAQGVAHGGGAQLSSLSPEFTKLVLFLGLLGNEITESNVSVPLAFWKGVELATPAQTLRRAALLLAGRLPTSAELAVVNNGDDTKLRQIIGGLMTGDNFHDFLTSGANDRLFTDAFFNGLSLDIADIAASPFFPRGSARYFADRPQNDEERQAKYKWELGWVWGLTRAPLELIAHVVMNNLSYTEILTADYMMLNFMSGEFLDPGVNFDDENPRTFKPGQNNGQIVDSAELFTEYSLEFGTNVISHGPFIDYPHAGILNTHAFLNRYPTTETNRNRARARWTYLHFLGVDIEKSAQRTTDPVALADTDNPTLNNPACTVCHSLHDPVAGTFQNFGNEGRYRDKYRGLDSLPDTYKYPQDFDENADPSPYIFGDTWFRDMRAPGFDGETAPDADTSLAWLSQRIVDDPRFASATVKFWWPAVMGAAPYEVPEVESDQNFQQQLDAFEAQNDFIESLGAEFAGGIDGGDTFRAKAMLTEMIMSPWFRAHDIDASNGVGNATQAKNYGTNRLLTPRELELKTRELLGWTWGESPTPYQFDGQWTALQDQYGSYYGAIDSNGIKERARALTALMANVAEKQALTMACPAVIVDFDRTDETRLLFAGISKFISPATEFSEEFSVTPSSFAARQTYSVSGNMNGAPKTIRVTFTNDFYDEVLGDRNLLMDELIVRNSGNTQVLKVELGSLGQISDCGDVTFNPESMLNDNTILYSNCSLSVPFDPTSAGSYTIDVKAWGDQAGSDAPVMLVTVEDNNPAAGTSAGALQIKNKLIDLHQTMLGESLVIGDEELEASYQLLVQTWQARAALSNNNGAINWPEEDCFWYLEEQYMPGGVAERAQGDPNQMLNTWMSMLIYFMTDFRYLHE